MAEGPKFRDSVLVAQSQLATGRAKQLAQHRQGALGIQICAFLADILDEAVMGLVQSACQQHNPQLLDNLAVVAHGGYGRREVAPYSDIDLMLLHQLHDGEVEPLARQLVGDLSDLGLELGFAVRTVNQTISLASQDPKTYTSLIDARLLMGNERLFEKLQHRFRQIAWYRRRNVISTIEQARNEERQKFGETVYLLEPNVKRSRGGLRDIQLLRWVGYVRYGHADLDNLRRAGVLSWDDLRKLRNATEFLLRLRNEMHFHGRATCDVLTKEEQLRLAELYQYEGRAGVLPVEQFMQEYFEHTSSVHTIVESFVATAKWRRRLNMGIAYLIGRRIDPGLQVGPQYLVATKKYAERVSSSINEALRLMDLAAHINKSIDPISWRAIRDSMSQDRDLEVTPEAKRRFLSFLSQPMQLGTLLRRLHELRILERIVPGFDHTRCLLQFNAYHKYTVDEHCIRAVECVTEFRHRRGVLQRTYQDLKDKTLLHLALLIHDLGKGFVEDHSEVGRRLAMRVGQSLNLSPQDRETLEFLVHKHLMLDHLAFRRDITDERTLISAAAEIGSPAILRMLYLLTCADLAAVGPGVLNDWKVEILTDLYSRLMDRLTGGAESAEADQRVSPQREELFRRVAEWPNATWYRRQIASLPAAYLYSAPAEQILNDLQRIESTGPDQVHAWGRFIEDRSVIEYSIAAHEQVASGIFHRLTGALSSQGLQILAAEIHSLADGLFLDRFYVEDPDYKGCPPESRFTRVTDSLVAALTTPGPFQPHFRSTWQDARSENDTWGPPSPPQVRIDNTLSDHFTIIDVFAHDRKGLLFAIARAMYQQGLSVRIAKIGTFLDQVCDVFYVTDQDGQKVEDELRLEEIRNSILQAIDQWGTVATVKP
ncbi:MAG: [protein-PII] uridylyltransferase [Pirellulales bacterium]